MIEGKDQSKFFISEENPCSASIKTAVEQEIKINQAISFAIKMWPNQYNNLPDDLQYFVLEFLCCSHEVPFEVTNITVHKLLVLQYKSRQKGTDSLCGIC